MNIRYYKTVFTNNDDYYAVDYDGKRALYISDDGWYINSVDNREFFDRGTTRDELESPDTYPFEERYIKATDRPSVDGFKHPELGVW